MEKNIARASQILQSAEAVLITAGAGMGVASGLPDFRGPEGFWRSYPVIKNLGLSFEEMANPHWFDVRPSLAWAFYGHRLHLYRQTTPHEGFSLLLQWIETNNLPYFIFTSNVDGQFQKTGFDDEHIYECHGSIHHLQCVIPCCKGIWENRSAITIDPEQFAAVPPLPTCPACNSLARPNILMFGDFHWLSHRSSGQERKLDAWLDDIDQKGLALSIIEMGAGKSVPTVRYFSETVSHRFYTPLIRINPRDEDVPRHEDIGLSVGAKEGLRSILPASI